MTIFSFANKNNLEKLCMFPISFQNKYLYLHKIKTQQYA